MTRAEVDAAIAAIMAVRGIGDEDEFLGSCMTAAAVPGWCAACRTVVPAVEPGQRSGACGSCGSNRVQSVLVLAEIA